MKLTVLYIKNIILEMIFTYFPDCILNNEIIKNGQEVISKEACQTCLCLNGNIKCKSKSCQVIHCTNPTVKDCCPSCDFGKQGRIKYLNILNNFNVIIIYLIRM